MNEIDNQNILHKKYPKNIPKIKTYYKDKKENKTYLYIIMDYLKNYITLDKYLHNNKDSKDNNINNCITILKKIITLVGKINYYDNFIHGDLHPANIMINKTGTKFYLIDFGYSVNFNIKNSININNIPIYLKNSFDSYILIHNLHDYFNIDDNILRILLLPNIKNYLNNYSIINDGEKWFNISENRLNRLNRLKRYN